MSSKGAKAEVKPDAWKWLESLSPLLRIHALSIVDEVATTVVINLANDQNHSSVTQRIMAAESFRIFTKEVRMNIVGNKRTRNAKERVFDMRRQHRQFSLKLKMDPKVMHRNLTFHHSGSAQAVAEVKKRKQSIETLCVMRWDDDASVGGSESEKVLLNMVNTLTASLAAVQKLDSLWARLRDWSKGQFLENPEEEIQRVQTTKHWYTKWFQKLARFSFQQLVASILEFALLRSFDNWCVMNKGKQRSWRSSVENIKTGYDAKHLSDNTSPVLKKIWRLSDFWCRTPVKSRLQHLTDAQTKVGGEEYLSNNADGAGDEGDLSNNAARANTELKNNTKLKRRGFGKTKDLLTHDEKKAIHDFFNNRKKLVEQESDSWTSTDYCSFFWDLVATPLADCSLPEHILTCQKALVYEIDVKRCDAETASLLFLMEEVDSEKEEEEKKKKKKKKKRKKSRKDTLMIDEKKAIDDAASDGKDSGELTIVEETPQERKSRKAREKRNRQKQRKAKRERERKDQEAARALVKEAKHRDKMVRRCVQKLIQNVELLIKDEIKEKERQRSREATLQRQKRKALTRQKEEDRKTRQSLCRQIVLDEVLSKRVFIKCNEIEESRLPALSRYEMECQRRLREDEAEIKRTEDERRSNQEQAAKDLDAEKARRMREWESMTNAGHRSEARLVQQELAKAMSEKERERRISEHTVAEKLSLAERGENARKAKKMVDQEQSRLILKYHRVQEKNAVAKMHKSVREELRLRNESRGSAVPQKQNRREARKQGSADNRESIKVLNVGNSSQKEAMTKWNGWDIEANDKKIVMLNAKRLKQSGTNSLGIPSTPPRSESSASDAISQQKNEPSSPPSISSKAMISSKDNREGMYRRGVVRALAVAAALEALVELAEVTKFGKLLHAGMRSQVFDKPSSNIVSSQDNYSAPDIVLTPADIAKEWPEVSCVVYGARAINSYLGGNDSPHRLHTEDLDVQVYLGSNATPSQFAEFCQKLSMRMTWKLERSTQELRTKWTNQAEKVKRLLKVQEQEPARSGRIAQKKGMSEGISKEDPSLTPHEQRNLEIGLEVATDRGESLGFFPWWRGQTTSLSMQLPSSLSYPGDDLPGSLVHDLLPEGDVAQFRSVLQPHDVTHAKWAVLGPVVDFTWLKVAPSTNFVELRPVTVVKPRVDCALDSEIIKFNVPTRSLRWLDRANLLTLMGKSLENEWRRSKDAHRRHYMAWLQSIGCVESTDLCDNGLGTEGGDLTGHKRSFEADWAELPMMKYAEESAPGSSRSNSIKQPTNDQRNVDDMTKSELEEEVRTLRLKLSRISS